jgi:hypothetical protein
MGIEGRTTGIQGWIIVDATIRLINRKTKQTTDVKTDDNGEYLACLSSGTYDVIGNALGYKPARRRSIKVVSPGRNVVDIVMTPSGLVIVDRLHP